MDFRRLIDLFPYQAARFPNERAMNWKVGGEWKAFSTGECQDIIDQVSAAMLRENYKRGDRVAIVSRGGSPFWTFLDLGLQQIGVVVVPIHAAVLPDELLYILNHADVNTCFVGSKPLFEQLKNLESQIPSVSQVRMIHPDSGLPDLGSLLRPLDEDDKEALRGCRDQVQEGDLATILYTSGTTGTPKGVMLSHENIVSNIKSIISLIPVNYEKRALSYLPLTHIFERMVVYTYLAAGTSVYFAESQEKLWEDIREVRPNFITAVPLVIERFYRQLQQVARRKGSWQGKIMKWAISVGKRYRENRMPLGYFFEWRLASLLVFRHWRKILGGELEGIVVGAAALDPELGRIFSAAGIQVREGYGLTETSPVVAFNRFEPGGVRFGTVGIPVPGVEVRISEPNEKGEGEILVRGPNVMRGYFRDEDATRQVLQPDGWLHTGDTGKFVHKRFLQINGRMNDTFKTASGKFVVPQILEGFLKTSPFIDQAMVFGANQAQLGALIVPDFVMLEQWCLENGIHWTAPPYMVLNLRVLQLMEAELERINQEIPKFEKIKVFRLLPDAWTELNGELTPTMKIRRRFIASKYQPEIHSMFNGLK